MHIHVRNAAVAMVATKVMKCRESSGGMFWVCPKDDQRVKI